MTQSELTFGLAQQGEQSGFISAPPAPAPAAVVGRITQLTNRRLVDEPEAKLGQTLTILSHLMWAGPITPLEALHLYGCLRLSARIKELRKSGCNIKTEMVTENGKRFARYSI